MRLVTAANQAQSVTTYSASNKRCDGYMIAVKADEKVLQNIAHRTNDATALN